MNSDFAGRFESNLHAALLMAPLTPNGAEARFGVKIGSEPGAYAQYYYPLDARGRNLLYAAGFYDNPSIHQFNSDGDKVATYDVRLLGIELKAGHEFGNYGIASLGYRRATGRQSRDRRSHTGRHRLRARRPAGRTRVRSPRQPLFPARRLVWQCRLPHLARLAGQRHRLRAVRFRRARCEELRRARAATGRQLSQHGVGRVADPEPLPPRRARAPGGLSTQRAHRPALHAGVRRYRYQLGEFLGRSGASRRARSNSAMPWEDRDDISFGDASLNASVLRRLRFVARPMRFGIGWASMGTACFSDIGRPF